MSQMFADGPGYDRIMGRWSSRLAPLFAGFANSFGAQDILDVGCGTGSLIRALASIAPTARIVGVDPSDEFTNYARRSVNANRVRLVNGDVSTLQFRDESFDQCLSLLVMTFVPEPRRAIAEMRRVTRSGGCVAACNWELNGIQFSRIFWEEAARIDPRAADHPYRVLQCNRPGELKQMWRDAGMMSVEEAAFEIETNFHSFEDFWEPLQTGVGPDSVYLRSLPPQHRLALEEALRARTAEFMDHDIICFRARALAVRGVV